MPHDRARAGIEWQPAKQRSVEMTSSFLRMVRVGFLLSAMLPVVVAVCSSSVIGDTPRLTVLLQCTVGTAAALALTYLFGRFLRRHERDIETFSLRQTAFIDAIPARFIEVAIIAGAGLSLLLELAIIRWQSTVWEFFAFYKNIGVLACFAGLGLGYALASRKVAPLLFAVPLIVLQMGLLICLRHGMPPRSLVSLAASPFREQLNTGYATASTLPEYVAVYFFLPVFFLLTALAFVPVGQLCGRLMERRPQLVGYRLNLLGSLAGVAFMLGISYLWTPPAVWFALCFLVSYQ